MPTVLPAVLTAILVTLFFAACGGDAAAPTPGPTATPETETVQEVPSPPLWRYVNSGWVSPRNQEATNAFTRELRVAVIETAQELENFNRAVVSKRTVGTSASLSRAEFPGSVLLVAYLLWLPVQGDPLSVTDIQIDGNRTVIELELDEDAQGREFPYLYAPMTMVTIDRDKFPAEGPVDFEFRLGEDLRVTLTDTLE